MFPESYMVGSHFDDVAEAKTGGLEMRRHKLEGIPKLRFGIIAERLVRGARRLFPRETQTLPCPGPARNATGLGAWKIRGVPAFCA
jgi:hypothetical protein